MGVGQLFVPVPLYVAKVAPPHRHGLLSVVTGCNFSWAYMIVVDATAELKGERFATGLEHAGVYGDEKVGTHRPAEVHSSNRLDI